MLRVSYVSILSKMGVKGLKNLVSDFIYFSSCRNVSFKFSLGNSSPSGSSFLAIAVLDYLF